MTARSRVTSTESRIRQEPCDSRVRREPCDHESGRTCEVPSEPGTTLLSAPHLSTPPAPPRPRVAACRHSPRRNSVGDWSAADGAPVTTGGAGGPRRQQRRRYRASFIGGTTAASRGGASRRRGHVRRAAAHTPPGGSHSRRRVSKCVRAEKIHSGAKPMGPVLVASTYQQP